MKGQRALNNKINKEGFTFDVLQPPYNAETFAKLRDISDRWLDGRKEKGFSLGFFSEDYLSTVPIAVVKNQQQEIVAFASFMPTYQTGCGSIDLMRHDPEKAPNGTMDFCSSISSIILKPRIRTVRLRDGPAGECRDVQKQFHSRKDRLFDL